MVLQFNVYSKIVESNGTISISIAAAAAVILLVLAIFVYVNRRLSSRHVSYYHAKYTLPQINRHCSKNILSPGKQYWEQLQSTSQLSNNTFVETPFRINIHSHVKNEIELELNKQILGKQFVIRNRGSCSSSSDSTSCNHDDDAAAVRKREATTRYARTLSLQEEPPITMSRAELDDQFSDIHSEYDMSGIVGKCGLLEVAFAYDAPVKKMTIHVLQGKDIPATDRGRAPYTQVHAVLLPGKKQKQKSKIRMGNNPQFMESFLFSRVTPEDVNNMSVRFRLYSCERMRRRQLVGECIISFSDVNLQLQPNIWIPLEPRAKQAINVAACEVLSSSQDSATGSMQSVQRNGIPELFIGLAYNGVTGRLTVEVIKGSSFRHVAAIKAPDAYVKLVLISSTGQTLARAKTSIRKSQPHPLFKAQFIFPVPLFQLGDVTLMLVVYNKKTISRKERIGWITFGYSYSSEDEVAHWEEMLQQKKGDQVARWHVLKET